MKALPYVRLENFKSVESVSGVKSIISKFAGVDIKTDEALNIKAAMMGFKDFETLKGLTKNYHFSAMANVGSDTTPIFTTIDLGYFSNVIDALEETKEQLKSLDPKMNFKLYMNNIDSGFYLPYQKECEYELDFEKIDGHEIDYDNFNDIGYQIVNREREINNLYSYIGENIMSDIKAEGEKELMIESLDFLKSIDDEFVLGSFSSGNDFIAYSKDPEEFNSICKKFIERLEKQD